jgi:hypothetical protein
MLTYHFRDLSFYSEKQVKQKLELFQVQLSLLVERKRLRLEIFMLLAERLRFEALVIATVA